DNIRNTYYYAYYGFQKGDSDAKLRMPEFPERVVLDVQLQNNVSLRWTGQHVFSLNTNFMMNDLTDLNTLLSGNSINFFTVFGNNYAMTQSPWWPQMQAAANMIPFYRLVEQGFKTGITQKMSDIFTKENEGINELFPLALSYVSADS